MDPSGYTRLRISHWGKEVTDAVKIPNEKRHLLITIFMGINIAKKLAFTIKARVASS
jgi:hypothetical protein